MVAAAAAAIGETIGGEIIAIIAITAIAIAIATTTEIVVMTAVTEDETTIGDETAATALARPATSLTDARTSTTSTIDTTSTIGTTVDNDLVVLIFIILSNSIVLRAKDVRAPRPRLVAHPDPPSITSLRSL